VREIGVRGEAVLDDRVRYLQARGPNQNQFHARLVPLVLFRFEVHTIPAPAMSGTYISSNPWRVTSENTEPRNKKRPESRASPAAISHDISGLPLFSTRGQSEIRLLPEGWINLKIGFVERGFFP